MNEGSSHIPFNTPPAVSPCVSGLLLKQASCGFKHHPIQGYPAEAGTTATHVSVLRWPPSTAQPHDLLAASKANQSILEQVHSEGIVARDVNIDPQVELLPANEVGFVQISAEGSEHQGRVMTSACRHISSPTSKGLAKTGINTEALLHRIFKLSASQSK